MSATPDQLNQQFGISGVARFDTGEGNLTRLLLKTEHGETELYCHGGHVTHYQPRGGAPVLWMSAASRFAPGQAIRGGVPIVFPWFGPHSTDAEAPSHGLVRTVEWSVRSLECLDHSRVRAELAVEVNALSVVYRVTVGRQLNLQMDVVNLSDQSIEFEQALHTYLAVGDVRHIRVRGLEGTSYIDKMDGFKRKTQGDEPIEFSGETDSVYLDTHADVRVEDPDLNRTIVVRKSGAASTVVWNPWIDKSKKMPDFGDNEWPGMVCIESANVADNAVMLAPNETASMSTTIEIQSTQH